VERDRARSLMARDAAQRGAVPVSRIPPETPTMFRLRAAVAICGALLVLSATAASALDRHAAVTQYGYQSWQTDTGLPQNTVHAVVQDPDGFLWIATEGGLVRFDGVQFAVMNRANTRALHPPGADNGATGTPGLPSDLIDDLMVDRSGAVWISTSGGLARLRSGKVEAFGPARGIPATQVWRTFQGKGWGASQDVWVLSAAGLFRIENDRGVAVTSAQDLTENSTMAQGPDGTLWLGTADGLMMRPDPTRAAGGAFRPVGTTGEVVALAVDGSGQAWAGMRSALEVCSANQCRSLAVPGRGVIGALASDASGQMWVGTDAGLFVAQDERLVPFRGATGRVDFLFRDSEGMLWAGTAKGLMRITTQQGAVAASSQLLPGGDVYLAAAEDREGDLWLGTESGGLAVLRDRKFSTLTAQDGLTDDYTLALAQSPGGDVWVATKGGGLNVLHDGKFHALTTAQGLSSNVVLAVAAGPGGEIWAGTPDGLNLIRNGKIRVFTTADGLADDFVRSLHVGRNGALWIGTRHGLSRYQNGAVTSWSAADGLGSNLIGAMAEGPDGSLWIGTLGGLSEFQGGRFRNLTTQNGLSSNVVTALYADAEGTLWIGTNDGGLNRMRARRIEPVPLRSLPVRVLGILEDKAGYLWISSNSGIFRVSRDGLNRLLTGGAAPEVTRYGIADGMRISECSSGGHPESALLRDGTLWFATLKGIARVDPDHMPVNRVPPEVTLERVSVDDAPVPDPGARLVVKPGHSHYEFDYAGLSFVAPEKVEYRYRLDGFDPAWVDAGTRRVAYYTNLPHGRYTFRVMARNNDGVWSRGAAVVSLTVEPHLWQTWWFRSLALVTLLGLGYLAWRRRLMRVEREFQAVLGERTRIAREIHDTLAQGFVAVSVQMELIAQLMRVSTDAAREQLDKARAMVRSSIEDARSSIWELRSQSAEQENLATRMLSLAEEVVSRAGYAARVQMQVNGTYRPLDPGVERELLRIAREAVVNSVRHAAPGNILLRLEFEGSMFGMEIRDDGRGFAGTPPDGSSGHFGMTGMRERAAAIGATLTVESAVGEGTTVRLSLRLAKEAETKKQAGT
jgi:ligand-binding sensor domain-containing protein/signal transduction histidine kinase